MMSLFSSFDWRLFVMPVMFIFITVFFFFNPVYKISTLQTATKYLMKALSKFFLSLKPKFYNKGSMTLFIWVFLFMSMINFLSVLPHNFPVSSQISFVLMLAGCFWLSMSLLSIFKNLKGFMTHLIPEGAPLGLCVFLFMIELISLTIRPLTLTVRLVANILAGHLLMGLLATLAFHFKAVSILYLFLTMVEMFVALIQAYIFSILIVLYFSEV